MIDTDADQQNPGNAVNDAAHFFIHGQQGSEPGIGIFQSKAGEYQKEESGQQDNMLHPLLRAHAGNKAMLMGAATDGLTAPDD